jgi:hypothetical protein
MRTERCSHDVKGSCRLLAVLTLALSSASASTIYSVRAEWLGAVVSPYTAAFEGLAAGAPAVNYHTSTGYTAGPINVVGYGEGGNYVLRNQHGLASSLYNWGTGAVLESAMNFGNTRLRITLAGGGTAFGIHVMTIMPGESVGIRVNGGAEMTVATSSNRATPTFWGITSDTAVDTVEIRPLSTATAVLVDNISTAMAAAGDPDLGDIPEASTTLLAAGGLLFIGLWRRKGSRTR